MTENLRKDALEYLRRVRMISVENLASALTTESHELMRLLATLEGEGRLRFGGTSCRISCQNCSTDKCENPEDTKMKESSIVISLIKEKTE
jgi:predicted metal-binding protein